MKNFIKLFSASLLLLSCLIVFNGCDEDSSSACDNENKIDISFDAMNLSITNYKASVRTKITNSVTGLVSDNTAEENQVSYSIVFDQTQIDSILSRWGNISRHNDKNIDNCSKLSGTFDYRVDQGNTITKGNISLNMKFDFSSKKVSEMNTTMTINEYNSSDTLNAFSSITNHIELKNVPYSVNDNGNVYFSGFGGVGNYISKINYSSTEKVIQDDKSVNTIERTSSTTANLDGASLLMLLEKE